MDDFETMYDKVAFECRCEDIASQEDDEEERVHIDKFHYKQVEDMVHQMMKEHGFYEKDN